MSESNFLPLISSSKIINKSNEVVNCLHPVIIANPVLKDLLYQHGNYTYLGKYHELAPGSRRSWCHWFPKSYFHPCGLSLDDLSSCYVTDHSTGEVFPMYVAVPCGHCDVCKGTKVDSFAERCELETQCYSHLPYFVTLTYNDECRNPDGLSVTDTQLFLKRFRDRLRYAGFNDRFRYVICGEYGHTTHREHYHLLLWNLYPGFGLKYTEIRDLLRKSWNKGFIYMSIVSPYYKVRGSGHGLSKPEKCFKYVAKYICKDCQVPPGKNPAFLHTSRRNGGIAAPFLDRHAPYIRDKKIIDFKYLDRFSNTLKSVVLSRYNLNRLFPSFSQSVPLELRNAVRRICFFAPFLKNSAPLMKTLYSHGSFRRLFWPLMRRDDMPSTFVTDIDNWLRCCSASSLFVHNIWEDIKILIKYKDFDLERCWKLSQLRNMVTSELHRHKTVTDLLIVAERRRRDRHLQQQREFF